MLKPTQNPKCADTDAQQSAVVLLHPAFASAPVDNPKVRGRPAGTISLGMVRRHKRYMAYEQQKMDNPSLARFASLDRGPSSDYSPLVQLKVIVDVTDDLVKKMRETLRELELRMPRVEGSK